ncbi:acyltransferase family protein [Hymenobacter sp. CRA2]|uniref:acyltransferase family protein n=1 Tax=Hymenobacter sp. CRA2 TaxID=1955620 RepID=UPI00098F6CF9|nr:acyltransferase family protein [Hymenobacter sp. CRA2]OON67176.1 hypothetical protein B0919_18785 [Hymenobacter sp. CRA2]
MPTHLEKINVLRGIAILLVFGYHALLILFGQYEIYDFSPSWVWIDFARYVPGRILLGMTPPGMGAQGVTLFLVISGFLIHLGYLRSGVSFRWGEFFNKRFWRIYPPYLVALLVFGLSLGTGGWLGLLTHLTLTHNLTDRTIFTINPSFWSLALEMQLYLLYPLLLLLRHRLGMAGATLAIGGLAILAMGLGIALQTRSEALWLSALNLWIVWALGAYLGEKFFYQQRIYTGSGYYLLMAYLLLTLSRLTIVYVLFGRILFSVFFIYVIDWYLHRPAKAGAAFSGALARFTALVGVYSYSIYLFHQPSLQQLIEFFSHGQQNKLVLTGAVALSFGVVLGLSYCTYRWLELPSIHWGKQLYARFRPTGKAALVPARQPGA